MKNKTLRYITADGLAVGDLVERLLQSETHESIQAALIALPTQKWDLEWLRNRRLYSVCARGQRKIERMFDNPHGAGLVARNPIHWVTTTQWEIVRDLGLARELSDTARLCWQQYITRQTASH